MNPIIFKQMSMVDFMPKAIPTIKPAMINVSPMVEVAKSLSTIAKTESTLPACVSANPALPLNNSKHLENLLIGIGVAVLVMGIIYIVYQVYNKKEEPKS